MTTHYIWDTVSDSYLMETDENGNITAEYITEPVPYGRVVSQRRSGVTSFYHYDGQGSTRQLTDESGNVTDDYTYSAFGETVASSGTMVNPFRFEGSVGYYFDTKRASYYVRARSFSPAIGTWLSWDPIMSARWHAFLYAHNNPVSHRDPSGLYVPPPPLPPPVSPGVQFINFRCDRRVGDYIVYARRQTKPREFVSLDMWYPLLVMNASVAGAALNGECQELDITHTVSFTVFSLVRAGVIGPGIPAVDTEHFESLNILKGVYVTGSASCTLSRTDFQDIQLGPVCKLLLPWIEQWYRLEQI